MITLTDTEKNIYLKRLASFGSSVEYKFNCISLFSGGGGLDLGAHFAGFKSLLVSDIIPEYTRTIKENLPHVSVYNDDAMDLTPELILEDIVEVNEMTDNPVMTEDIHDENSQVQDAEIQKESEMNTAGLSKDSVLVDDTLSNQSIVIIIISAVLILSGGFLIIKLYINKKKIK